MTKRISVNQLEADRLGLINYIKLLEKNIKELQARQIMAKGTLQYVNQLLLSQEDKNGDKRRADK